MGLYDLNGIHYACMSIYVYKKTATKNLEPFKSTILPNMALKMGWQEVWCGYADHLGLGNAESCEKDLEMYEFYQKRYKEMYPPIKK